MVATDISVFLREGLDLSLALETRLGTSARIEELIYSYKAGSRPKRNDMYPGLDDCDLVVFQNGPQAILPVWMLAAAGLQILSAEDEVAVPGYVVYQVERLKPMRPAKARYR
jgi:hypothetical protein